MVDLRRPKRDWSKHPPSLTAVVATLALVLILAGLGVSGASSSGALPAGAVHGAETVADVLFGAGTVVAGIFVVLYVFRLGDTDPRKGRYKSD